MSPRFVSLTCQTSVPFKLLCCCEHYVVLHSGTTAQPTIIHDRVNHNSHLLSLHRIFCCCSSAHTASHISPPHSEYHAIMATLDVAPPSSAQTADSSAAPPSLSAIKRDKVCDYYLLGRGCVKGDECDFIHPKAPDGSVTSRLCDYFYQPRGCSKADSCNWLHVPAQQLTGKYRELHPPGLSHAPAAAAMGSRAAVCQYYLSPNGCKKGSQCDHLHPGFQQSTAPISAMSVMAAAGGRGVCSFYLTPQGCKKGSQCDRDHIVPPGFPLSFPTPVAAIDPYGTPAYAASLPYGTTRPPPPPTSKTQPTRPVPCPYFLRPTGCKKGEVCEMIHQKQEVCSFMIKYGNCKKGEWCDYLVLVTTTQPRIARRHRDSASVGGWLTN